MKIPNLTIASFQEPVQQANQEQGDTQNNRSQPSKSLAPDQEDTSPQLVATELSLSELAKRIKEQIDLITSNDTLDDASKQEELTQLNFANQIVKEAQVIQKEIANEEQRRKTFPRDLKEMKAQLSFESAPDSPKLDRNSKQIETELKQKNQKRDELKAKQVLIEDKIEELANPDCYKSNIENRTPQRIKRNQREIFGKPVNFE